jgi:hypothetical protein
MRNNPAFYRTDEISREPTKCPDWLDLLATKFAIDEERKGEVAKTAVEVARERQQHQPSIYEMMSAIVSNQKPKYSSVEEAVKDYQRQTGLEAYLKREAGFNLGELASQIIAAAEYELSGEDESDARGVCHKCGCTHAECECDKDDAEDGGFFRRNLDYGCASDSDDSRDATEEELEAFPDKKKTLIAQGEKPEILENNPAIEHFIINMIETNHGIQIPALLHSLMETFNRDGVNQDIFSDRSLLDWINNILIEKGVKGESTPSHLGRGVGTHVDYSGEKDSNRDPFTLLEPDKSSL